MAVLSNLRIKRLTQISIVIMFISSFITGNLGQDHTDIIEKLNHNQVTLSQMDVTTGVTFEKTQSFYVYTDFIYIPVEVTIDMSYDDIGAEISLFNMSSPGPHATELINQVISYTRSNRKRRSWPEGGLLPFIGMINSKFTGVATLADIEDLKIQSKSLSDYVDGFKKIIKEHLNTSVQIMTDVQNLQINLNSVKHSVSHLVNLMKTFENHVDSSLIEMRKLLTYHGLKNALESRHMAFELYKLQLTQTKDSCNIHHLSESLIPPEKLKSLLLNLNVDLTLMNLSPAIDIKSIDMYYSLPLINCHSSNNVFWILINVPIVPNDVNEITMYKVKPIPMIIGDDKYLINTDNIDLISTSGSQTFQIDISTVVFSPFRVDRETSGIIQSNGLEPLDSNSCLSRLFSGSPISRLKQQCQLNKIDRTSMSWIKLNESSWYYSGLDTELIIEKSHQLYHQKITTQNKTHIVTVPCGIIVRDELGNILQPNVNCNQVPVLTITPIISYLYFNRNTLYSNAQTPFLGVKIDWNNEELNHDFNITDYTQFQKKVEEAYHYLERPTPVINWESRSSLLWTYVGIGIVLISVLIIVICLYKKCGVPRSALFSLLPGVNAAPINIESTEFWIFEGAILVLLLITIGIIFRFLRKILIRLSCHNLKASNVSSTTSAHIDLHVLAFNKYLNIAIIDLPFPTSHYNLIEAEGDVLCPADGTLLLDNFNSIRDIHGNIWNVNGKYHVQKLKSFPATKGTMYISSFMF